MLRCCFAAAIRALRRWPALREHTPYACHGAAYTCDAYAMICDERHTPPTRAMSLRHTLSYTYAAAAFYSATRGEGCHCCLPAMISALLLCCLREREQQAYAREELPYAIRALIYDGH